MINMDEQIRTVLSRQADAMIVPEVLLGEHLVHVGPPLQRPRHLLLGVAASLAVLLALGATLAMHSSTDRSPANVPPTLSSETGGVAGQRFYGECLFKHGMAVKTTTPDGDVTYTVTGNDATVKAAAECQRIVEHPTLPGKTP
jgi:hypothetical protein